MRINKDVEKEFERKWDVLLDGLREKQELLKSSHTSLQNACDNVSTLSSLIERIMNSTQLIPETLDTRDRADLISFYVRVYTACIIVTLDDINFTINGRILSVGRREEVDASDISSRINWHHKQFSDVSAKNVMLSNNCVDGFVQEKKLLKRQFALEWNAIEDERQKTLSEEELSLRLEHQRPLHTSPFFIMWLAAANKAFADREVTDYLSNSLSDLELRMRDELGSLTNLVEASEVNIEFGKEYFEFVIFDETVKISRQRIDKSLHKSSVALLSYRDFVMNTTLPEKKDSAFKLIESLLQHEKLPTPPPPSPPELSLQERRERLKSAKSNKASATPLSALEQSLDGLDESDAEFDSELEERKALNNQKGQPRGGESSFLVSDKDFLDDGEESTGGGGHHRGAVGSSRYKRKASSGDDDEDGEEEESSVNNNETSSSVAQAPHRSKQLVGKRPSSRDDELMTFLYNSHMMDETIKSYAVTLQHNGMNLLQALQSSNVKVADVLIEAVFEACCVDDVCEDVQNSIIREQNVAAFHNLKRLVSGCKEDQVVTFKFKTFFAGVYRRAYDRMKIVRKGRAGVRCLEDWEQRENENLSLRIKASLLRVKLRTIYIYAHINDQVDRLDMKKFKRCGFLSIHQGIVRNCRIPLTSEYLLEITGTTSYTPADMEAFTQETLSEKIKKSALPSLHAIKEERQEKRLAKKEEKKGAVSPSSVAAVSVAAAARSEFLSHDGLLELDEVVAAGADVDVQVATVEQMERDVLASPLGAQVPRLPSPPTSSSLSPLSSMSSPALSVSNTTLSLGISPLRFDAESPTQFNTRADCSAGAGSDYSAGSPSQAAAAVGSTNLASGSPLDSAATKTLLKRIFRGTEGSHAAIKISLFCNFSNEKFVLSLVQIVAFVVANKDRTRVSAMLASEACVSDVTFQFSRAYGVDSNGSMLACMNTEGDGYCMFRATLQALMRSNSPTLSVAALKSADAEKSSDQLSEHIRTYIDMVKFANPHTDMYHQTKLEECLFNAENLVDKLNPRSCWGDSSWMRFLPFHFALLDFTDKDSHVVLPGIGQCRWGLLTRVPFHLFNSFYYGTPTPTLKQLRQLVLKPPNYLGYSPGHNFLLDNPLSTVREAADLQAALEDWCGTLIPVIGRLTSSELDGIHELGVKLIAQASLGPPTCKTMETSIGVVEIDDSAVPVVQYNTKMQPMCCDTLFVQGPGGGYNKHEVDELLNTLVFLRSRVDHLKSEIRGRKRKFGQDEPRKSTVANRNGSATVDLSVDDETINAMEVVEETATVVTPVVLLLTEKNSSSSIEQLSAASSIEQQPSSSSSTEQQPASSSSTEQQPASSSSTEQQLSAASSTELTTVSLWYSPVEHAAERLLMTSDIQARLLSKTSNQSPDWLEKLPRVSKVLETEMFMTAVSFEEYKDRETFKLRLSLFSAALKSEGRSLSSSSPSSSSSSSSSSSPDAVSSLAVDGDGGNHDHINEVSMMVASSAMTQDSLKEYNQQGADDENTTTAAPVTPASKAKRGLKKAKIVAEEAQQKTTTSSAANTPAIRESGRNKKVKQ